MQPDVTKALDIIHALEWEEEAFQEVLQGFKAAWRNKRDRFIELSRENSRIRRVQNLRREYDHLFRTKWVIRRQWV